jgi:hypothetical protein
MPLLVSLTRRRVIYLALELDRSWTETCGVNPLDGTNYLGTLGSPKMYDARAMQATWTPSLASDGHMSEYPTNRELTGTHIELWDLAVEA